MNLICLRAIVNHVCAKIMTTCCHVCMIVFALFCMNTNCNHVAIAANSGSKKNEIDRLSLLAFREQQHLILIMCWIHEILPFISAPCRASLASLSLWNCGPRALWVAWRLTWVTSPSSTLIDLANISFHGGMPQEVGSLFCLQRLSLRNNESLFPRGDSHQSVEMPTPPGHWSSQ